MVDGDSGERSPTEIFPPQADMIHFVMICTGRFERANEVLIGSLSKGDGNGNDDARKQ